MPHPSGPAGIDNFGFYVAFTFFRMAGILQGVKKPALKGNASNPERALRGAVNCRDIRAAG